ncbi:MAG: periplasmic Cu(I)/Cu(II)-binding protein CopK [Sterolibacterium sp.]
MFKKFLIVAAMSAIGVSAYAFDTTDVQKSVQLKDGSTVHIFKDGKMAMEDKLGRTTTMTSGEVMEDKSGQKTTMQGNEAARFDSLQQQRRGPSL